MMSSKRNLSKNSTESNGNLPEIETNNSKAKRMKSWNLKVLSWNVAGLRAWLKKDGLAALKNEDPDIICLQELKCSDNKLPTEFTNLRKDYFLYTNYAKKEGYSGVALLSKTKPVSVKKGFGDKNMHDEEGRLITAEFENFYVVTAYVPNSGRKLVTLDKRMDWEPKMRDYLKKLDEEKFVIYAGDLNVAHEEIDLTNPKTNHKSAGFTDEERGEFTSLLKEGFVDSYRELYPDLTGQYTFWSYMMNCRAKNVGWRLDYFVLSKRLLDKLHDNVIQNKVMGSDHCPIVLFLNMD